MSAKPPIIHVGLSGRVASQKMPAINATGRPYEHVACGGCAMPMLCDSEALALSRYIATAKGTDLDLICTDCIDKFLPGGLSQ